MKINVIKDFNRFFEVVDKCKGKVEVVSPEGDCLCLTSMLCQFLLHSLAEKKDVLLDSLEIKCEDPEDTMLFIKYLMEG